MIDFREIIDNLHDWHFYDVVLPFILVYVIVFAVLEKSKIFKVEGGDNNHVKNVNSVIAFVFGLFVVASIQTVQYIQSLIVNISLIIIFILVTMILLGFIFGDQYMQLFMEKDGNSWKIKPAIAYTIGIVVFLTALISLLYIIGWMDWFIDWWDTQDFGNNDIGSIVIVIGVLAVLYWITKGDSKKD